MRGILCPVHALSTSPSALWPGQCEPCRKLCQDIGREYSGHLRRQCLAQDEIFSWIEIFLIFQKAERDFRKRMRKKVTKGVVSESALKAYQEAGKEEVQNDKSRTVPLPLLVPSVAALVTATVLHRLCQQRAPWAFASISSAMWQTLKVEKSHPEVQMEDQATVSESTHLGEVTQEEADRRLAETQVVKSCHLILRTPPCVGYVCVKRY